MIKLFALIIGLLLIKPATPAPKYDFELDAKTLYNEYWNSKSKADAKYLNKKIFLHGIVQERSANLWHVYLRIPHPDGMCATIDDDQLTKAPMYKEGDKFDLICVNVGLVFNIPLLLHCRVP